MSRKVVDPHDSRVRNKLVPSKRLLALRVWIPASLAASRRKQSKRP